MRAYQHTVGRSLAFFGAGLHTGLPANARILPAPPDTGIVFRRTDVGAEIPATVDSVVETAYATVLARDGVRLSTVEHFMAALYGMEIDNALVEVDGPELPILDGSALGIARAIADVGASPQAVRRRFIRVWENETIRRNGSLVMLSPAEGFEVLVTVEFPGTAIGRQWARFVLSPESFLRDVAPARTFVLRDQIEALRAAGFARGGSLDNTIVVEVDQVHNNEGLRFRDEFARHKLLDFIGDIALLGHPIRGAFVAVRPGHTVNRAVTDLLASLKAPAVPTERAAREAAPTQLQATP